jgi:hypothetical protein
MLHFRARSLRTALLATALTTAVAVPASAGSAAPAVDPTDQRTKTTVPVNKGDDKRDSNEIGRDGKSRRVGRAGETEREGRRYGKRDRRRGDHRRYGKRDRYRGRDYRGRGYGRRYDRRYGRYGKRGYGRYGKRGYGRYGKRGFDRRYRYPYTIRTGPRHGYNEAEGQISWSRNEVRNSGWIMGKGRGTSILTFHHHWAGKKALVRRFVAREGRHVTGYRIPGRFNRIVVEDCRVFSYGHQVCKVKTFKRDWR